ADARPEPDCVSRMLARMDQRGWKVGAVTGRLLRPPAAEERLLDACGMRLVPTWRHLDRGSGEPDRGQFAVAERVFGGTGAATLPRRAPRRGGRRRRLRSRLLHLPRGRRALLPPARARLGSDLRPGGALRAPPFQRPAAPQLHAGVGESTFAQESVSPARLSS